MDIKFREHEAVIQQNKSDIETLSETVKKQENIIKELQIQVNNNSKDSTHNSELNSMKRILENEQIYVRRKKKDF